MPRVEHSSDSVEPRYQDTRHEALLYLGIPASITSVCPSQTTQFETALLGNFVRSLKVGKSKVEGCPGTSLNLPTFSSQPSTLACQVLCYLVL